MTCADCRQHGTTVLSVCRVVESKSQHGTCGLRSFLPTPSKILTTRDLSNMLMLEFVEIMFGCSGLIPLLIRNESPSQRTGRSFEKFMTSSSATVREDTATPECTAIPARTLFQVRAWVRSRLSFHRRIPRRRRHTSSPPGPMAAVTTATTVYSDDRVFETRSSSTERQLFDWRCCCCIFSPRWCLLISLEHSRWF